ncbi:unnamed protein product [Rhizopus microsporus]
MSIINKNTVKQLQAELAAAKAEITRLKQQNASLLERLAHAFNAATPKKPASTLVSSPLIFPPLTFPSLTSGTSSQMAAPRTFSVPSVNHGYKFLYATASLSVNYALACVN